MKSTLTPEDFVFRCKRISEYYVSPPNIEKLKNGTDRYSHALYTNKIKDVEIELIRNCLNKHNGNRTRASKELGISTTTLWRKLKQHGIYQTISH